MNKNNQNGKSWDRGVSRKYYEDLRGRVEEIALAVNRGNAGQIMDQVMGYVDAYLENPSAPFEPDSRSSNESDIIFLTLREDIARAVERSRRAKARAASRRKVKAAEPVEVTARREPGKRTKPGEIAAPVNYTDVSVSAVQQSE
ncbi:MAG: hypothetical protein K2K72_04125, partial [Duncaniella sp.]|nr:hypothetical protein [Duncaniella sp.]